MRERHSTAAAFLAALLLVACQAAPPAPPPPKVTVIVAGLADLNPGPGGRGAPALLRIYQLGSAERFQNSDFFALFDGEEELLGEDLKFRDEQMLLPGADLTFTQELREGAAFVGLLVAYREVDRLPWRAVAAVPAEPSLPILFVAEARGVAALDPRP